LQGQFFTTEHTENTEKHLVRCFDARRRKFGLFKR